MARITAVLHTHNDGLRLGRCLETLYPCDEILIVDHGSRDGTVQVAREYGAKIIAATNGTSPNEYFQGSNAEWIMCLDPRESLTESLAASLFEWKSLYGDTSEATAFCVFLREETADGWIKNPTAQTRLVPHGWRRWQDVFPITEESSRTLEGDVLRFEFP